MKDSILKKIEHIHQLAKSPATIGMRKTSEIAKNRDSLSNAIRNQREASIFLAELDAAVKGKLAK